MHLIYGSDNFLINQNIKKISKQVFNDQSFEIIRHSMIYDDFFELYNETSSRSLFSTNKLIIISDCYFLTEKNIKLDKNYSEELLFEIISSVKKNNDQELKIIFTLNEEKLSNRLKTTKNFINHVEVIYIDKPNDGEIFDFIRKKFYSKNKKISDNLILHLLNKLPKKIEIINNEVNKLLHITSEITKEKIDELISTYSENDIFQISNAIVKNDSKMFVNKVNRYFETNTDYISLLSLISSNLILTRNSLVLKEKGYDNNRISQELGSNEYRLKMLLKENKKNIHEINQNIKLIYLIQYNILEGKNYTKSFIKLNLLKLFV